MEVPSAGERTRLFYPFLASQASLFGGLTRGEIGMPDSPLVRAQAGIQFLSLGPRFRRDERGDLPQQRKKRERERERERDLVSLPHTPPHPEEQPKAASRRMRRGLVLRDALRS